MNIICLVWNMHISIFQIRQIFVLDELYLSRPTFWFKILACILNDVNWKQLFWFEKVCLTKKIEVVVFNVINTFLFWVYRKSALPKVAHLYTAYTINIAPTTYPENLNLLNIPPLQLSSCIWHMIHNVSISKVRNFSR